jgi:antitoxin component of RelBE/YafQ-DinJ toxin-antitoxin module
MENSYIQVRISPTLRAQLKAEAEARGLRPTELIRLLVVDCIDNHSRVRKQEQQEVVR